MRNKKSPKADLEKRRMVYLQIGLIVAASVSLAAFEWRVADGTPKYVQLEEQELIEDAVFDVDVPEEQPEKTEPQRQIQPTPPMPDPDPAPPMPDPDPNPTPGPEPDPGPGYDPNIKYGSGIPPITTTTVTVYDQYTVAVMPEFPGGIKAMYEFLGKNIKYPGVAREMGVEGKVYVEFIVSEDGSIKSTKILGGPGSGCNEEAERVVKMMPDWIPGEHLGKKVRVKYVLPIHFKLK